MLEKPRVPLNTPWVLFASLMHINFQNAAPELCVEEGVAAAAASVGRPS